MDFRNQSFRKFLVEQGFPPMVWIMLIFFILMASGVIALEIANDRFPWGALLLFIISGLVYLFPHVAAYRMYKKGADAVRQLNATSNTLIRDVKVAVKNYDLFSTKKTFPPNPSITIYDFDNADLLLTEDSIVLMGKGQGLFGKTYAAPVMFMLNTHTVYFNTARILSVREINNQKIELKIHDPNYTDELMVLLPQHEELIKWITKKNRMFSHDSSDSTRPGDLG